MCRAHDLGSYAKGQGHNQVRGQNRVAAKYSQTTAAILTKLHRKIEHNEKVCHARELCSYAQDQGHKHVKGQTVPKIVLLINYEIKFDETSQKDKG